MTSLLEFSVPTEEWDVGRTLRGGPDVVIEPARFVPIDGERLPYVWVSTEDPDAFEAAIRDRPDVAQLEPFNEGGDPDRARLYRVEWAREPNGLLDALRNHDLMVLRATGTDETWQFEVLTVDRTVLEGFQAACEEADVPLTITRLVSELDRDGALYGLSAKQRTTMVAAYENGYFDRGSGVTLADVGDELGISRQATGDRINRGMANLVETLLV